MADLYAICAVRLRKTHPIQDVKATIEQEYGLYRNTQLKLKYWRRDLANLMVIDFGVPREDLVKTITARRGLAMEDHYLLFWMTMEELQNTDWGQEKPLLCLLYSSKMGAL
jgi:hypothetical protein